MLKISNLVVSVLLFVLVSFVQVVYATELQLKHDHHAHHDGCHVTDPKNECVFKSLALPADVFDDNSIGQVYTIYQNQPNVTTSGFAWLNWHGDIGLQPFALEAASERSSDRYVNPYGGDNTPKVNNWVYGADLSALDRLEGTEKFKLFNFNKEIRVPLWKAVNTIDVPSSIASHSFLSWMYQQFCHLGLISYHSHIVYQIGGYAKIDYLGGGYSGGDRDNDSKGNNDQNKYIESKDHKDFDHHDDDDDSTKKFWIKVRFKGFIHCFNTPPVAQSSAYITDENKAVSVPLKASDADGDALTYTITANPTHGTLSGTAPNLVYTPSANYYGADTFTYSVSDGVFTDTGTINLTVNHVNQAPVAQNVSATLNENTSTNLTLVATDVDSPTLTYTITAQPQHGTLTGNGTNWVYTPATNYYGTDTFSYSVSDGQLSATATGNITVTHVNQAPVAQNASATTNENTATNVTLVATDVDSPTLTYTITTQPQHGTLTGTGANWVYTPATNYYGTDTFSYSVSDGQLSATATGGITVNHVNQAPVAKSVSATTNENVAANVILVATDVDSPTLTYSITTQPQHGTLTGSGTNWVYTPATNYYGSDTFTYSVSDGQLSATATGSITVIHVNQAPVAQNVTATTNENTSTNIPLIATDVDSPTLTYTITAQPQHGTLTGSGANWIYTPATNYYGTDTFSYSVSDGQLSATATGNITVNHVNQAPVAQNVSATTNENVAASVVLVATDVDGDPLTYSVTTQPLHGTLSGTGANLTYTPATNFYGTDTFTYSVSDGSLTSTATAALTVNQVNHPPVVSNVSAKTSANQPVTVTLLGTDADGDTLSYAISQAPANGTVTINNNQAVYTPNAGFTGQDTFTYIANDGIAPSTPATVTVTVSPSTNAGQDFWLTYFANYVPGAHEKIYISSTVNTTATIEIPGFNYSQVVTVTANTPSVVDLTSVYDQLPFMTFRGYQNITSNAGIHVYSNDLISVYALNTQGGQTGETVIYPTNSLGKLYLQTAYDPPQPQPYGYGPVPQLAAIVATQDNTSVTINLAQFSNIYDQTVGAFVVNSATPSYGTPYTVVLNKGQTYHLIPGASLNYNLDGMFVQSDKPIAFFTGNASASVPFKNSSFVPDHFYQQNASIDQWGQEFVTIPSASRSLDYFRIYAATDNTLVYVNHQLITTLNHGGYYEATMSAGSLIQTSKPVWVNQFATSVSPYLGAAGEAIMRALVPTNKFASNYVFSMPTDVFSSNYYNNEGWISQNYIEIIAKDEDVSRVLLDGQAISAVWQKIVDTGYKYVQILVSTLTTAQQHTVTADHPVEVSFYGFSRVDAYGTPTGDDFFNPDAGVPISISLPTTLSTPENQALNLDPMNSLSAGQTATIAHQPTHGTITQQNGTYVYTPTAYYHGVDQFTFNLINSGGVATLQTVYINIVPIYYPLQSQVINLTTNENSPVNFPTPQIDVNGQKLTYSTVTAQAHGQITFTSNQPTSMSSYQPSQYYFGSDSVVYQVTNGQETSTLTVNFTIVQIPQHPITASQSLSVPENATLPITLTGSDPNGGVVTFAITTPPKYGTLSGTAPNLTYTPNTNFTGTDSIGYTVSNGTYTTSAVVSISVSPIPFAQNLSLDVPQNSKRVVTLVGTEVGNPVLTYQVLTQPTHGTLSGTAPNLIYTATANYLGADSFTYQVSDGKQTATGTVALNVANIPPLLPVWTSTPNTSAQVGQQYSYTLSANDPSAGTISYSLGTNAPQGMSLTGNALTWTPSLAQAGALSFDLIATTSEGGVAHQTVSVFVNIPPAITSTPVTTGAGGRPYQYQVTATDPNNYPLTYSLVTAPSGLQIDANTGLISWANAVAGSYTVVIGVSDGHAAVTQNYSLTVAAPQPLGVSIQAPNSVNINTSFTATVALVGAGSDAVATLKVDGNPVSLDVNHQAVLNFAAYGSHTLTATVSEGKDIATTTQTIFAADPSDSVPAVVTINNTANPLMITKPTDITGTITDKQAVLSWTVSLYSTYDPDAPQTPIWTKSGTGEVNGTLATIDPTMMVNGAYTLDIKILNAGGLVTDSVHNVVIAGKMKVGDLAFTLQDAVVPMPGIDISLQRNYDSRNSAVSGDFGYGWQLGSQQIKIQQSRPVNTGWEPYFTKIDMAATNTATGYISLRPVNGGDVPIVSVTLPNGTVETFKPQFGNTYGANVAGKFLLDGVAFNYTMQPTGNTDATFDIVGTHSIYLSNGKWESAVASQDVDANGNVITNYNWFIPDQFTLTTKDGTTYKFSKSAGLQSITDLEGHSLTIYSDGIKHSSGVAIIYTRDGFNRITRSTLPDGSYWSYNYDGQGNLASATSPAGIFNGYTYDAMHRLLTIVDANGKLVKGYSYDADGRLIGVTDALGNTVQMTHNLQANQEAFQDKLGNTTTYTYDDYGNVINELDALGHTTLHTYNTNYDELSRTDANGNTTSWTYDDKHNKLTETDARGRTTTYTYNPYGILLTQIDSSGRTVATNTTDNLSRPTQLQDAAGNNTAIAYSSDGMTSLTDALGHQTQYAYTNGNLSSTTDAAGKTTSYTYDSNNRKVSQTETYKDAAGIVQNLVTTWVYDADGNVLKQTNPDGSSHTKTYDAFKNVLTDTDSLGRVTSYAYDGNQKLIQTTYADGTTSHISYDANGNVLSETDRLGRVTQYAYDALNRKVKTTLPNGAVTTIGYDAVGNITSETDANGNTNQYRYDALNRKIQTINALNQSSSVAYDDLGRMTSSSDANGNTTQYSYDVLDHLIKTTYADQNTRLTSYDALGHKLSVTNELGQVTQYGYDVMSHLISVTDAQGQMTRYGYDQDGHKVSQTDALNRTTTWAYDPYGRQISRSLPLGQTETNGYDTIGRLASHTDFNGRTTSYLYDNNDQIVRKTYADGSLDALNIDAEGRLLMSQHIAGSQVTTNQYAYDNADHLIKEIKPTNDGLSYQYDSEGNKTQMVVATANGSSTQVYNYHYDALNRLTSITDPQGTTVYTYDANGNKTSEALPNGIITSYNYNARNRLVSIAYSTSNGMFDNIGYGLDAVGNRLAMIEIGTGINKQTVWQYDNLNRLVQEEMTDNITAPAMIHTTTYSMDAVGNRTNQSKDGISTDYAYDNNDRLLSETTGGITTASYSYDNQGNTISVLKNGVTTNYSYDTENQLVQSGSSQSNVQFTYDIDGIRSSKTTNGITTNYITDKNRDYAQVVLESNGATSTSYSYGDQLISATTNMGTSYVLKDAQGSTKALTNSSGATTDTYSYNAYGETTSKTGTTANNYLYAGEQYDPDLNQYYNRARYYNQAIGRFSQQDSYQGNNQQPISLHKYLYANGNPLTYTDPSGNMGLGDVDAAISISTILDQIEINTSQDLLDNILGNSNPNLQQNIHNTEMVIGIASLGTAGFKIAKMLSRKFAAMSRVKQFNVFRNDLFSDLTAVNPRSMDRIALSENVFTLQQGQIKNLTQGEVYVYVVDESNNMLLALRGSAGRTGVKHTELSGGAPVKAAGELVSKDGVVTVNNRTGRYRAQSSESLSRVKAFLESEDVQVETSIEEF
ncbi:MAG: tandem-95 repeat protein [Gammaproteobacteria bacterium]|nr:tandem-95 repeat protein [Gammaproteobacteria bacterium]